MVSVRISALQTASIHFVNTGVKVNGRYYREVLLMQKLPPDIRHHCCVFQQDSAPVHSGTGLARRHYLLIRKTPDFVFLTL